MDLQRVSWITALTLILVPVILAQNEFFDDTVGKTNFLSGARHIHDYTFLSIQRLKQLHQLIIRILIQILVKKCHFSDGFKTDKEIKTVIVKG